MWAKNTQMMDFLAQGIILMRHSWIRLISMGPVCMHLLSDLTTRLTNSTSQYLICVKNNSTKKHKLYISNVVYSIQQNVVRSNVTCSLKKSYETFRYCFRPCRLSRIIRWCFRPCRLSRIITWNIHFYWKIRRNVNLWINSCGRSRDTPPAAHTACLYAAGMPYVGFH